MSILEMMKVQFYLAASQEEYDKTLAWVKECEDVEEIKEVGLMHSTDWVGNPMDTYGYLCIPVYSSRYNIDRAF